MKASVFRVWNNVCPFFGRVATQNRNLPTVCPPLKHIYGKLKMLLKLCVSNFQIWERRLPPCKQAVGWDRDSSETGQGRNQSCRSDFLPASFWSPLLQTSLTGKPPQFWTFKRRLRRCGSWSEAGGALPCSRKLHPQRFFLQVPCPQQVSGKTPIANKTKPKSLDSMFMFFWRTTTSTFDFGAKMFVLENANKYVWLAFK